MLFIRAPFYVLLVFIAVCSVFWMVVLPKLSLLARWLARKTPLRKPNRGEGIVSRKPRPKSAHEFLGLLYCFIVLLCISVDSCPYVIYYPTVMVRYSLFVLKVPLNSKQTNLYLCLLLLTRSSPVPPPLTDANYHNHRCGCARACYGRVMLGTKAGTSGSASDRVSAMQRWEIVQAQGWKRTVRRTVCSVATATLLSTSVQTRRSPSGGMPLQRPQIPQWNNHNHRRHVVRVDRCAALWPLTISDLHSIDSGRALASF